MSTLAKNMLRSMLDPIFKVYGEAITFDEHRMIRPRDADITVDTVPMGAGKTAYVFTVNPFGSRVMFKAVWCNGEYLGCDIDSAGLIGSLGEYAEMMSSVVCEVHRILEAYAKVNNFPSVNLLPYSELHLKTVN